MNRELARTVRERAGGRCEYCPHSAICIPAAISSRSCRSGEAVLSNLALACPHCNRYKGPNIAGRDPELAQLVRLFHPRTDVWTEHFQFDGPRITGRTPIGRVTAQLLAMNADDLLLFRAELIQEGTVFA